MHYARHFSGEVVSITGLYLLETQILWAAVGQTAAAAADPVSIRGQAVTERLGTDASHTLNGAVVSIPRGLRTVCERIAASRVSHE